MIRALAAIRYRARVRTRLRRWLGLLPEPPPSPAAELQPCFAIWGETEIRSGLPLIDAREDVMLLPFDRATGYDRDRNWGVYSAQGDLIDAAALHRGGGALGLAGQASRSAVDIESLPVVEGELVYGGVLITHYGHFICTSLSRLWPLAHAPIGDRKIVFHGGGDLERHLARPYIAACFERLGLTAQTALVVDQPLRVRSLAIPGPSFEEQTFVTPEFQRLCQHIGRPWWIAGGGKRPPVYLSKRRLKSGLSRFTDEALIEDTLRAGGVEIIYPETLTFPEQVSLFSQDRTILGSVGSAFHTSIFAPPGARLICLATDPTINSNMHLLDAVNGAAARYVYPSSGGEDRSHTDGFGRNWILREPARVAEEMLDLAFSR